MIRQWQGYRSRASCQPKIRRRSDICNMCVLSATTIGAGRSPDYRRANRGLTRHAHGQPSAQSRISIPAPPMPRWSRSMPRPATGASAIGVGWAKSPAEALLYEHGFTRFCPRVDRAAGPDAWANARERRASNQHRVRHVCPPYLCYSVGAGWAPPAGAESPSDKSPGWRHPGLFSR